VLPARYARTVQPGALVLAIDTSTAATCVAVVSGGALLAERVEVAANRHGEVLAPLARRCVRDAGALMSEIAQVAVGVGPGPFTGLRVGLVTARALGSALGVEVRGACSLDVIAAAHRIGRPVAVVTDARRREVYWATYDPAGRRIQGPAVDRPAHVAEALRAPDGAAPVLAGAGALLHRSTFEGAGLEVRDAAPYPHAALLAGLALDPATGGPPHPLYLRRPDATPPTRRKLVTPA
jgi:tRNA threonylcarbamoyladenosine biosynthesis protein TsaB